MSAVFRDKDGSLGAGPDAYVLINDGMNDSIATDADACVFKPTWNAAVCKGDVGRLAFAAPPRIGGAAPGAGAPPPQPPIVLSRNGRDYPILVGGSNVRAGTEIKLTTERLTLPLRLTELDKGSWVIFQLPGFNTAAAGTQQTSLDALRKASENSYFKDKDALWVKLVSPDSGELGLGGVTTLQVSR
jgi:cell migration-inducing and hyaluronan-binding protein